MQGCCVSQFCRRCASTMRLLSRDAVILRGLASVPIHSPARCRLQESTATRTTRSPVGKRRRRFLGPEPGVAKANATKRDHVSHGQNSLYTEYSRLIRILYNLYIKILEKEFWPLLNMVNLGRMVFGSSFGLPNTASLSQNGFGRTRQVVCFSRDLGCTRDGVRGFPPAFVAGLLLGHLSNIGFLRHH